MATNKSVANENNGMYNGRAAYSLPLGYSGLRAEFSAAHTNYGLGGIYAPLNAVGYANIYDSTLFYPLIRTREQSVDVSLNLAYKQLRDNQSAVGSTNPRGDEVATLGIQKGAYGSLLGKDLFTMMSGSVSYGTLTIQDPEPEAPEPGRCQYRGNFRKSERQPPREPDP